MLIGLTRSQEHSKPRENSFAMKKMPETDMPSRKTKSQRLMDLMSPSERVLRVHRKNFACARALRLQMAEYDVECRRALRKVQQEIFEVYFDEYLPLKSQARFTTNPTLSLMKTVPYLPNLAKQHTQLRKSRANMLFPISNEKAKRKDSAVEFQSSGHSLGQQLKGATMTSGYKPANARRASGVLPLILEKFKVPNRAEDRSPDSGSSSPLLHAGVTDERLRFIQTTLALTSQPPPPGPKRTKKKERVRKIPTFTVSESDVSPEKEPGLRRNKETREPEKVSDSEEKSVDTANEESNDDPSAEDEDEIVGHSTVRFPSTLVKSVLKWRPSLARNKIINDEETDLEASQTDIGPGNTDTLYDALPLLTISVPSSRSSVSSGGSDEFTSGSSSYSTSAHGSSGLSSPDVGIGEEYGQEFPDIEYSSMGSYSESGPSYISSSEDGSV